MPPLGASTWQAVTVQLTPQERDRLLLFTAAELARARRARGLLLNVPEAIAIIADAAAEVARDGGRVTDAIQAGRSVLSANDVLPGVTDIVSDVRVEAMFDDGTRLIVVTEPFGACADLPDRGSPGAILHNDPSESIGIPEVVATVSVTNTSDVPISVTSHYHFFECNPRLSFDRRAAYGMRLAIDAGATVRFDPGATIAVDLTPIIGGRTVIGFSGLVDGDLDADGAIDAALAKAHATGFLGATS